MVKKGANKSINGGTSKLFLIILFVAIVLFVFHAVFIFTPALHFDFYIHDVVGNIFIVLFSGIALISSLLIYKKVSLHFPRERRAKFLLVIVLFFFFIGDLLWLISEVFFGNLVPVGSFPDFFWLLAYAFLVVSLIYFISIGFRPSIKTSIWIIILSLFVGGVVLGFDVAEDLDEGSFTLAHSLQDMYILFDFIVLFLVVYLVWPIIPAGFRFYSNWLFLGVGIVTRVVYDQLFANMSQNGTYYTGHPIDLLYVLFYIFAIASFYLKSKNMVVTE